MNPRDVSFNAHEQVEILAEIIKAGNVHPDLLFQFIRNHGIQPNWGDVALPRGRTLNQCLSWYNGFANQSNQPGPSGPVSGHMRSQSLHDPGPSSLLKRPFSPDQPFFAGGRPLFPKPPMTTIGNILNQATAEPPKKKRGRPSNAQKAVEREAAIARGELLPVPKREVQSSSGASGSAIAGPSSIATFAAQAAQAAMTPHPREPPASASTSESSSGKKKRGRPTNAEKEARRQQATAESRQASESRRPIPTRYPDILSPQEDVSEDRSRAPEGS